MKKLFITIILLLSICVNAYSDTPWSGLDDYTQSISDGWQHSGYQLNGEIYTQYDYYVFRLTGDTATGSTYIYPAGSIGSAQWSVRRVDTRSGSVSTAGYWGVTVQFSDYPDGLQLKLAKWTNGTSWRVYAMYKGVVDDGCSNGIKDPDEVGIDCGGSCPEVCEAFCPPPTQLIPTVFATGYQYIPGTDITYGMCGYVVNKDALGNCPTGYTPLVTSSNQPTNQCGKSYSSITIAGASWATENMSDAPPPDINFQEPVVNTSESTTTSSDSVITNTVTINNADGSTTVNEYAGDTLVTSTTTNTDNSTIITNYTTTTTTTTSSGGDGTSTTTNYITNNYTTTTYAPDGTPLGTDTGTSTEETTGDGDGDEWGDDPTNYDWDIDEPDFSAAEITDDDIPEQDDWVAWFNETKDNNPIKTKLDQFSVDASGTCSITGSFYGQSVSFSICEMEPILPLMRNILMFCSLITAWFIVTGRAS